MNILGLFEMVLVAFAVIGVVMVWASFTLEVWRVFRLDGGLFALGYLFLCAAFPALMVVLLLNGTFSFDWMEVAKK